jgi:predicted ATPase/DNA-binding SARP family transcriptional activator
LLAVSWYTVAIVTIQNGWRGQIEAIDEPSTRGRSAAAGQQRGQILLLGSIRAVLADGRVVEPPSASQRRLLALLAIEAGQTLRPDYLADILAISSGALRSTVSRLRRLIGPSTLITGPAGYQINAEVDAATFTGLVSQRHATERLANLDEALGLWHGVALDEFRHESWAAAEAARLDALHAMAIEDRAELLIDARRCDEAIASLEPHIVAFPLRDRARALLMRGLAQQGRQAEALRAFQAYRMHLAEEVGTEPSAEVRDLERRIADGSFDHELDHTPSGFSTPGAPIKRRTPTPREITGSVPVALTELLGREASVVEAIGLLDRCRLVSLTGYGGVGKTRVAIEVASRSRNRFDDGVWWVELAPLAEPSAVVHALASQVDTGPVSNLEPLAAVISAYADRNALFVLDNCEHLAVECERVVRTVLERCPRVSVLTTSRVPLGVSGEHLLIVEPLSVDGDPAASPAVQLFVDRAQSSMASFELTESNVGAVVELCRRLDGLPLAIELAASRVRCMSPARILSRLPDRFKLLDTSHSTEDDRHHSMLRTLQWSYELLTPNLQSLFDHLSVFAGSFDATAAEQVCASAATAAVEVADQLAHLVDHSMLSVTDVANDEVRYQLAETFREFGRDHLRYAEGLTDVEERFCEYWVQLAETARAGVRGVDEAAWRQAITNEISNLRAAHALLVERDEVDGALRIVIALYEYAFVGLRLEVGDWAAAAVAMEQASSHPLWADATAVAALMAWAGGSPLEMERHLAVLDQRIDLASPSGHFLVEFARGLLAAFRGRMDELCTQYDRCREIAAAEQDNYRLATISGQLAFAHAFSGREDATDIAETGVAIGEALGNPSALATALWGLGTTLVSVDPRRALECLTRTSDLARNVGATLIEITAESSVVGIRDESALPVDELTYLLDRWKYWHRAGPTPPHWHVCRKVAFALLRAGDYHSVAVMLGAEGAAPLRLARPAGDERRIRRALDELDRRLGTDDATRLLSIGAAMDHDGLDRHVVDALRRAVATVGRHNAQRDHVDALEA